MIQPGGEYSFLFVLNGMRCQRDNRATACPAFQRATEKDDAEMDGYGPETPPANA